MKSKLHFGILVVLFTFLGRYMETSVVPNQQIVIQFSDTEVTEFDVQKAIEDIRFKLRDIGAENLLVGQDEKGNLKIAYYTSTDVKHIENILSENGDFKVAFQHNDDKSDKKSDKKDFKDYKLNVSEIQKSKKTNDWDFDGVQIVEHNHKSDRFNNLKKNTSGYLSHSEQFSRLVKISIRYNSNISVPNNHSYKIPEVRAGPRC